MTKHTPGPWKYTPSIPEEGCECFWIESDDEFKNSICVVDGPQDDECEANARLIAAAPDLLDALKFMMETVEGYEGPHMVNARAAIAKALGESGANNNT